MDNMPLQLQGYGYVRSLFQRQQALFLKVDVIDSVNTVQSKRDEILLNCEIVLPQQIPLIKNLVRLADAGRALIIAYIVEYTRIKQLYCGQTEHDPDHILLLDSKLLEINTVYENGKGYPLSRYAYCQLDEIAVC